MDSTHAHLLLNHFPIIGTLIGTILLLFGVWKKNSGIQIASLVTIIVMALLAIPVFLTGEPAEESVENLPGVIKSIIEEHEEAAEIAFWVMMVTGAVSLIGMALKLNQNKMANNIVILSLVLGLVTSGLMARAGYLGGQIRHTEIRTNLSSNPNIEQTREKEDE